MTAYELANKLLAGDDYPVTVRGYEGGVNEIAYIDEAKPIHLNAHSQWYYGQHEYHETPPNLCHYCDRDYSTGSLPEAPTDIAINLR